MKKHDIKSLATAVAVVLAGLLMTTATKANLVSGSPSATGFSGSSAPAAGQIASVYYDFNDFSLAQAGSLLDWQGGSDGGILKRSVSRFSGFNAIDDNRSPIRHGMVCSIYGQCDNPGQAGALSGISTLIAGVLLLLPFVFSTARILCRRKSLGVLE
jgi:VIT1/CCC1 family predicted Fe2+/Mn2+ transporter